MPAHRAARLVLGLSLALAACSPPEPLKLAYLAGLTGSVADLGDAGYAGVQLAVSEINAAGGIGGRQVELLVRDDGQDPEKARAAVRELAAEGVVAIIGPMTTGMAHAVLPVSEETGLLLISPSATGSSLSGRDDTLLMVLSSTQYTARQSADYNYGLGYLRIAAIYDTRNQPYSEDWLQSFRYALQARGGRLVTAIPFTSGQDASYVDAVQQLQGMSLDAIMYVANAVDTVRLVQAVRAQGRREASIGVTWSATEQLLEMGGRTVEEISTVQLFNRDDNSARYLAFQASYRERFKSDPGFASIAAYDGTQALAQALRRQSKGQTLKQALLASGPYPGLQGEWSFDRNGDVVGKSSIAVVRRGRFMVADK
jgi:branched-chain amino acid transport system substrate-binding protein